MILDKPSEPIYVHERAKCYLVIQEYEKALSDFNMVLSHQTANQNAYLGRGFTYKALKKYQLAANDFEQAKVTFLILDSRSSQPQVTTQLS